MLVDRIDDDKDGFVTQAEMIVWIRKSQSRWMLEEVERQFKTQDLDGDGLVTWEEYKNATYGYTMGTTTQCPAPPPNTVETHIMTKLPLVDIRDANDQLIH